MPLGRSEAMSNIKFGTDGWRGIIAEDFTHKNIKRVSQAIADYLGKDKKIAVAYDTRFMSGDFANIIAKVLSGNNTKVIISNLPLPTPMLSYYVKNKKLDGGIIVTASHNPSIYNGIKFKEPYGCSSLPETTNKIESLLDKSIPNENEDNIKKEDISGPYLSSIKRYLIPRFMRKRSLRVVVDSMYGAGGFYLEKILKNYGHKVITIHGEPNPLFPGINPEPVGRHLKELVRTVKENRADIGIATDGDGDRVGIVDNKGNVLTPHYVLSLLFIHLKTSRNWDGCVVKTISSTSLINKIAEKFNILVKETPVGFKYIAELMLKTNVLIGGEESGGNGFKNHIPERDGILSGLLLVEMIGRIKKKLTEIVKDMEREFGVYKYKRIDLHTLNKEIKNLPEKLAGRHVVDIKTFDGAKFILDNGAWLLIRASGTEPILRIYAEAPNEKLVSDLINSAKKLI